MFIQHSAKVQMSGHIAITAVRPDGTERSTEFKNLIVDSGIDFATASADDATATLPIKVARFGSGTAVPANNDVDLTAPHGDYSSAGQVISRKKYAADGTVIAQGDTTTPLAYTATSWTFTFNSGTVPAGDLSEIGIFGDEIVGSNPIARTMWAHALIKDDTGTPTAFTIQGDEVLYVRYELRKYIPADVTGSVTIAGTAYDYTIRPINVNSTDWNADAPVFGSLYLSMTNVFDTGLVDIHDTSNGTPPVGAEPGSMYVSPYTNGTGYRDVTVRWEALEGLITGGISKFGGAPYTPVGTNTAVTAIGAYQVGFVPPVVKDDRHRLSITLRYTLTRQP